MRMGVWGEKEGRQRRETGMGAEQKRVAVSGGRPINYLGRLSSVRQSDGSIRGE